MGGAAGVLGDDATIRAAYVSHGGELYRFALRSLREPWLAEDAAPAGPPRVGRVHAGVRRGGRQRQPDRPHLGH